MRSMIGEQVIGSNKKILGKITNQFKEDGQWFGVVDNSYEILLDDCTHHLDIFGYERAKNPKLEASFVKLSVIA